MRCWAKERGNVYVSLGCRAMGNSSVFLPSCFSNCSNNLRCLGESLAIFSAFLLIVYLFLCLLHQGVQRLFLLSMIFLLLVSEIFSDLVSHLFPHQKDGLPFPG